MIVVSLDNLQRLNVLPWQSMRSQDMEYRLGFCSAPVTILFVTIICLLSRGFYVSYFTVGLNGSQLLM